MHAIRTVFTFTTHSPPLRFAHRIHAERKCRRATRLAANAHQRSRLATPLKARARCRIHQICIGCQNRQDVLRGLKCIQSAHRFWTRCFAQTTAHTRASKPFNLNYGTVKPQFILGYLTHYPKLDLWTFSFWEGDTITARDVAKSYRAAKTFVTKKINLSARLSQARNGTGIGRVQNPRHQR